MVKTTKKAERLALAQEAERLAYNASIEEARTAKRYGRLVTESSGEVMREEWRCLVAANGSELGVIVRVRQIPMCEVYDALIAALETIEPGMIDEYLDRSRDMVGDSDLGTEPIWPSGIKALCCFATTGDEGHRVHVDAFVANPKRPYDAPKYVPLFIGKTYRGLAHAQQIANHCGRLLGA